MHINKFAVNAPIPWFKLLLLSSLRGYAPRGDFASLASEFAASEVEIEDGDNSN
jgi:hypothetical protein